LAALGSEVFIGLQGERAVVGTDARDAGQELLVLNGGIDQTHYGKHAQQKQRREHCRDERHKHLARLRGEPHRHQRARQRQDVEGSPCFRFADRGVRRRLQHKMLGDDGRHER
jgi:hypothetical protein